MIAAQRYAAWGDPTQRPPPAYTKARADEVYRPAFQRAVEFVSLQRIPGDVLEFGTLNGYTARILAELMAECRHPGDLYLFDSFEGMPETRSAIDRASYEIKAGAWKPGTPVQRIPGVEERITEFLSPLLAPRRLVTVKGWYKDTAAQIPASVSLAHIDCDLYDSALTVLKHLPLQQGMILLFDDWNSGRGSNSLGERRAFKESRINAEPWFSYGWHGQAFIVHER